MATFCERAAPSVYHMVFVRRPTVILVICHFGFEGGWDFGSDCICP